MATETLAQRFMLDPSVTYLNHGSFGACPREVLDAQSAHRERLETEPVRFFVEDSWGLLDRSRTALGNLVNARPRDLVFVRNATTGVTTALRNIRFEYADEILVTEREYTACINNGLRIADETGAKVRFALLPWPVESEDQLIESILTHVSRRTRVVLLSLITSSTGVRLPIERLIKELDRNGIDTILDAAHGPGCVPMDIKGWGAAYTTGNAHKWLCAPKGAAFLHVREDRQPHFHPLVLSNDARDLGRASKQSGRTPFNHEFDYAGTDDITPYLTISDSIDWLGRAHPGGISGVMDHNRDLALKGRSILCEALGVAPSVPESMIGPLAAVDLHGFQDDPSEIWSRLNSEFNIQVPVWSPTGMDTLVRISAQIYNHEDQYRDLARALSTIRG